MQTIVGFATSFPPTFLNKSISHELAPQMRFPHSSQSTSSCATASKGLGGNPRVMANSIFRHMASVTTFFSAIASPQIKKENQ